MDQTNVPRLKRALLTERILIAVEPEIKTLIEDLKHVHKIDMSEWMRMILRAELPKLKSQLMQ